MMTKLSKEDIARIEAELAYPFGCVVLRCDSDTITIQVERSKPREYVLTIYVNGWLKLANLKRSVPEHRYYRPVTVPLYKPAQRASIERTFGKRKALKYFPKLYDTGTYYMPSWRSTKPMLRHFERITKTLSVVSIGVAITTSIDTADTSTDVREVSDV
ncbi:hypothetical protein [Burkholderia gladioli]|uniref:hypothetical protein n=1 Tax=Burkholderia gladioli TaxID=28095 RepID=UPI00163E4B0F|nr:hypothetical protein [Burkholderia gladioli]